MSIKQQVETAVRQGIVDAGYAVHGVPFEVAIRSGWVGVKLPEHGPQAAVRYGVTRALERALQKTHLRVHDTGPIVGSHDRLPAHVQKAREMLGGFEYAFRPKGKAS